jgi:hypothetical protein
MAIEVRDDSGPVLQVKFTFEVVKAALAYVLFDFGTAPTVLSWPLP